MTEDRTLFDSQPENTGPGVGVSAEHSRLGCRDDVRKTTEPTTIPTGVPHNGTDTSREAARRISPLSAAQAARLFYFVAKQGETGATDHEIQAALDLSGDTERPRRWGLVKAGLIEDSGRRRNSPSGRPATIYVATAEGLSQSRSQAS
jgi:hypothetical protein